MLMSEATRLMQKAAAGDQQSFETSLAAIGRAVISSRAPSIARHEIGFQVLDQDDDNTRAVGVFGYRIGRRLYYVPMFYRDGVTKGVEQLRDPKRKRVVPLSDNWVNQLLTEYGGDDDPKSIDRGDVRNISQPSMWQLKYPPTKWAADGSGGDREWFEEARRDLAGPLTYGGGMAGPVDAVDLMKVAAEEPSVMHGVQRLTAAYPWFADALTRYHTVEQIKAAADAADRVERTPARPRERVETKRAAARLTVIRVTRFRPSDVPSSKALDYPPEDLKTLSSGKNVYRDSRSDDEVSTVVAGWNDRSTTNALANPGEVGVQQVLGADMKLHECVVLLNLTSWAPPIPGDCLVIRVSDGAWARPDRNSVWAATARGVDLDAGVKWHESLKDGASVPTGTKVAAVFMDGGKQLRASVPFTTFEDGCVCPDTYHHAQASYWASAGRVPLRGDAVQDPGRMDHDCQAKLRMTPSAARLTVQSNCLYMPSGGRTRVVDLGYDKERLKLASGDDPDNFLFPQFKAAADGLEPLRIERTVTGEYHVDSKRASVTARPTDVEAFLVETHHMRPADAAALVAAVTPYQPMNAFVRYPNVKSAEGQDGPYRLSTTYPNAPPVDVQDMHQMASFADDVVPSKSDVRMRIAIPDLAEAPDAAARYRPYPQESGLQVPLPGIGNSGDNSRKSDGGLTDDDVMTVANAARSGVKELFDTAAVAVLVKRTRLDTIIERMIKATNSWMTAAADCLCHMYWNVDDWSERFGTDEVGPMEDHVRDHFEGIGKLALGIQEKAVNGGRDFGLLPKLDSVDAASAAGA